MSCSGLLFVLSLSVVQVPPPSLDVSRELEAARRAIAAREAAELNGLARRLDQQGETEAARQVRQRLPRTVAPGGATRFVPLPEVVALTSASPGSAWHAKLTEIQSRSAADLYELAQRAAKSEPPSGTLPGGSRPSTSRSKRMSRSRRRSASVAASRHSTTYLRPSWPTSSSTNFRWSADSRNRR